LLNYACTRLALKVVRERFGTLRYWLIALLTGIFKNVADEFYRRLGGALRRPSTGPSGGCGGLPGISGGNPQ
jgi:membrane associated rhomboid family serine protease